MAPCIHTHSGGSFEKRMIFSKKWNSKHWKRHQLVIICFPLHFVRVLLMKMLSVHENVIHINVSFSRFWRFKSGFSLKNFVPSSYPKYSNRKFSTIRKEGWKNRLLWKKLPSRLFTIRNLLRSYIILKLCWMVIDYGRWFLKLLASLLQPLRSFKN